MRDSAHLDGTSGREANNYSVAGSILLLGLFDDVVEPEPKTGSQLLTNCSYFPWHMAKTIASGVGMTNAWLHDQGLVSLKSLWVKRAPLRRTA